VAPEALKVLRDEGIMWRGKPKGIEDRESIDIAVSMGCEVACPAIPGAKRIDWDIEDPRGKGIEAYRKALSTIKKQVTELVEEVD
jgi:arsenate reductase